ncbi:MAG: alpha/beta hydrolase [Acidobacteriaceae bacterium]
MNRGYLLAWATLPIALAICTVAQQPQSQPHAPERPFDQAAYSHPQRLVNIGGGRRMNLYCTGKGSGKGSATVIMDSGGGGWTLSWRYVQPLISAFAHTCSYDRAGLGFSDGGPMPRTTSAIVHDLHALLHRAGVAPPYILVGHSMGAFDVRLFADRYPKEVAGMVLVDPADENANARFARILPRLGTFDKDTQLPQLRACAMAVRRAHEDPKDPQLKRCIPPSNPQFSLALNTAMRTMALQPKLWEAMASELASEDPYDRDELRKARRSYGTMPLIVLTGGAQFKRYQKAIGLTDQQVVSAQLAWKEMHDAQAAQSSRGVNQMVPAAGHDIQVERPDVVSAAIQDVLRNTGGEPK